MNFDQNFKGLIGAIEEYRDRLKRYSEEQFQQKPLNGGWSAAQVYSHIITADRLSTKGIAKALQGNISETDQRIKLISWWLLFIGKIPKGIKAPKALEERTSTFADKEQAEIQIQQLLEDLEKVKAQKHQLSRTRKFKHPFLGLLNSFEWLRFMEIHSKHHLKQLDRIERMIK
jgi:hypothetical protein